MPRILPFIIGVFLIASPSAIAAATITVDAIVGDYADIQSALDAAAHGDTVLVLPGVYFIDAPIDFNRLRDPADPGSPPLKDLVLRSESGADVTIIQMSDTPADHDRANVAVFGHGEGPDSVIEGFTITGAPGLPLARGLGIKCTGGSSPTIRGCTVAGNGGGGIWCDQGSSPGIEDCRISSNGGEGLLCFDSSPRIERCAIERNDGGIQLARGSPVLRNCIVAGNRAMVSGGGISLGDSRGVLDHCTISGNSSGTHVGGIHCWNSSPEITSCIVWGNSGPAIAVERGADPAVTFSCIEGTSAWPGDGNIAADPLFCGWPAAEAYVDEGAAPGGDGTPSQPFATLPEALGRFRLALTRGSPCLAAGEGGTDMGAPAGTCEGGPSPALLVHLAPGKYGIEEMDLSQRVSIEGAGRDSTTIAGCIFGLRTGASLSGVTVSGETSGIWIGPGESPEVRGCAIRDGSNGVICEETSAPAFRDCTISGNEGSGALLRSSDAAFTDCSITGNVGTRGGGVFSTGGSPSFTRCTVSGNSADAGGGLLCSNSSPTLRDCLVEGNRAWESGGAFFIDGESSPVLEHCTVSGNRANRGGGLSCTQGATATITDSIVWDNAGGSIAFADERPAISRSCIEGAEVWPGEGNLRDDPRFCGWPAAEVWVDGANAGRADGTAARPYRDLPSALAGFRLALAAGSPCRGAGKDGTDMGAPLGACEGEGSPERLVHIAAGSYGQGDGDLTHRVSLEGSGRDATTVLGGILSLRTGGRISDLTVTGEQSFGGIAVASGEAPEIRGCAITGNRAQAGGGVSCWDGSAPRFEDCIIAENLALDCGAGISCTDASPVLERCTISGNRMDLWWDSPLGGGGLFSRGHASSPVLTACTIAENVAGHSGGGGVALEEGSGGTFTGCTIAGNSGTLGGGLFCAEAAPILIGCTIGWNSGGGVCVIDAPPLLITDCRVTGNSALCGGGGILAVGTRLVSLRDCVIADNDALDAGGIALESTPAEIVHCTVSGNVSAGGSSAIGCSDSSITITSSIIWGNGGRAVGCDDPVVRRSCIEGPGVPPGEGNIATDPLFCGWDRDEVYVSAESQDGDGSAGRPYPDLSRALEGYDLRLGEGSPCLGTGEGGTDMGAPLGTCAGAGSPTRLIQLGPGSYSVDGLHLARGASIEGAGADTTTLRGTVVGLRTGSSLSGVTVTEGVSGGIVIGDGQAPEVRDCTIAGNQEGGIVCEGSSPTIAGCLITGNSGIEFRGGGVSCQDASPTLRDCTISSNQGMWGGGVFISGKSSAKLEECTVVGNSGSLGGGGILCQGGWVELSSCTVSDNTVGESEVGGGLSCSSGATAILERCTVSGNRAAAGGGISCTESNLTATDCRIARNSADWSGGGLDLRSTTAALTGSTIALNWARLRGGGASLHSNSTATLIHCTVSMNAAAPNCGDSYCPAAPDAGISIDASTVSVKSSIIWGNAGGSIGVEEGSPDPVVARSCIEGAFPGTGNIDLDPLFCGWPLEAVHVDASRTDPGDGSEESPHPTIAAALEAFSLALGSGSPCRGAGEGGADMGAPLGTCEGAGGRLIRLSPGRHSLRELNLAGGASLEGAGEEETVVEGTVLGLRTGARLSRLTVTGGTASGIWIGPGQAPEIDHCTIAGNSAGRFGGGVRFEGASPTFRSCTIAGNTATDGGGGMYFGHGSAPRIIDCTIIGNYLPRNVSGEGGGIFFRADCRPEISGCTIAENEGCFGGGISWYGSSPKISGSTISRNVGVNGGGVYIRNVEKDCAIADCTIRDNLAQDGGGIHLHEALRCSFTIEGCTIAGNRSWLGGGGLFLRYPASAVNCIIAGNSGWEAGGMACGESASSFTNCTIAGNGLDSLHGSGASWITCAGEASVFTNCIVLQDPTPPGCPALDHCLVGVDPLFVRSPVFDFSRTKKIVVGGEEYDVPDFIVDPGDLHLREGSPAIDAGAGEEAPATDIEGSPRPCGKGADLGAYESCAGGAARFRRGDVDGSGGLTITDAIVLLEHLYLGGPAPPCLDAADADDSGVLDLTDAIANLSYQFLGGVPPASPFPGCGTDPSMDGLDCREPPACE
jgi:hypothetical protein